jgi:hypothetical protein
MIVTLYQDNEPIEIDFRDAGHSYKVNGTKKTGVTTFTGILNKPELLPWAAYMAAEALKEAVKPFVTSQTRITQLELKKLTDEAKKAHTRKSGTGKDIGSIVHAWIKEEIAAGQALRMPSYTIDTLNDIDAQLAKLSTSKRKDKIDVEQKLRDSADEIQANTKIAEFCIQQWRQFVLDYGIEFVKVEQIVYSKKLDYCGTMDTIMYSKKLGKTLIGDYKTSEPQRLRNKFFQIVGYKPYPEHFVQMAGYDYAHFEETGFVPDGYMVVYLPKDKPYQVFTRCEVELDKGGWENLVRTYRWIDSLKKGKSDVQTQ